MSTSLDSRICKRCGTNKPITSFTKNKQSKDGYRIICKDCDAPRLRAWRQSAGKLYIKRKARQDHVQKQYGLDSHEYGILLNACDRKCEICGTFEADTSYGTLYVDHSHSSNKVRGMLCQACNTGLGNFKDDIKLLLKAVSYLETKV